MDLYSPDHAALFARGSILSRMAQLLEPGHDHDFLSATDDAYGVSNVDLPSSISSAVPHDLAMLSPEQVHEIGTVLGRRA